MTAVTPARVAAVLKIIDDSIGNIPTGGGGRSPDIPDPTGRLATQPDQAVAARDQITELEQRIIRRAADGLPVTRDVQLLDDLLARWEPPTGYRRANLADSAAGRGDDGCRSCQRIGRWTERHPGLVDCQRCHRDLKRVRASDGHEHAEQVPLSVLQWREANQDKPMSDDRLRNIITYT